MLSAASVQERQSPHGSVDGPSGQPPQGVSLP